MRTSVVARSTFAASNDRRYVSSVVEPPAKSASGAEEVEDDILIADAFIGVVEATDSEDDGRVVIVVEVGEHCLHWGPVAEFFRQLSAHRRNGPAPYAKGFSLRRR